MTTVSGYPEIFQDLQLVPQGFLAPFSGVRRLVQTLLDHSNPSSFIVPFDSTIIVLSRMDELGISLEGVESINLLKELPKQSAILFADTLANISETLKKNGKPYQMALGSFIDHESPDWRMIRVKIEVEEASTQALIGLIKQFSGKLPIEIRGKALISCVSKG